MGHGPEPPALSKPLSSPETEHRLFLSEPSVGGWTRERWGQGKTLKSEALCFLPSNVHHTPPHPSDLSELVHSHRLLLSPGGSGSTATWQTGRPWRREAAWKGPGGRESPPPPSPSGFSASIIQSTRGILQRMPFVSPLNYCFTRHSLF